MDLLKKAKDAKDNEVIEYVVYKEHTLGYLFKVKDMLSIGILASSVIRGGRNPVSGPYPINWCDIEGLRKATQADFDDFRVHSEGYPLDCHP